MAHFAKLNENNMVTEVIVIDNKDITVNGIESEKAGQDFISNVLKLEGKWLQTSYNNKFRHSYAGVGSFYDEGTDRFITLEEKSSWVGQMPKDYIKDQLKKTILVDGFPRSGNIYLSYVLAHAFPETNQFTGYISFHNIETVFMGPDKADFVFIAIRNPLDSIRSLIKLRQLDENDNDLLFRLAVDNLEWMKKISENKNKICIIDFKELTTDLNKTIDKVAMHMRQFPIYVSENDIKNIMLSDNLEYNLPNNTTSGNLEITNTLILNIISEATDLYNRIVS